MYILGRCINSSNPPYIIAEVSANHNGNIAKAKKCISAAKSAGAHAVKIQTYEPQTMTINSTKDDFLVKGGLWDGYTLFDLYSEAQTPFAWHQELFDHAKKIGITLFSTPFDETAVDLLESLDAPAYKIASFELTDVKLIQKVAATGKPLLMSTGMATYDEISEAVNCARKNGAKEILLFHCISSYPAPIEKSNLKSIQSLQQKFDVEVGLSDHTLGNIAAISSVAIGATAIEKHFTLDKSDKGHDSAFSIDPAELKKLVLETSQTWKSLGTGELNRQSCENSSLIFRRSLYFVKDHKAGDKITKNSIRRIRPGYGLLPKYQDKIIGLRVSHDVKRGDRVTADAILGLSLEKN